MFVAKTEKIVKLGKAQTGPGGRTGSCRSVSGGLTGDPNSLLTWASLDKGPM